MGGCSSLPPLHPKRPATQSVDEVILELPQMANKIDELLVEEEEEWPPRRVGEESMEKWRGPSVCTPLSGKEEKFRQRWMVIMCPECHYVRGHGSGCNFVAKLCRWAHLGETKTKARPPSASPHLCRSTRPHGQPPETHRRTSLSAVSRNRLHGAHQ